MKRSCRAAAGRIVDEEHSLVALFASHVNNSLVQGQTDTRISSTGEFICGVEHCSCHTPLGGGSSGAYAQGEARKRGGVCAQGRAGSLQPRSETLLSSVTDWRWRKAVCQVKDGGPVGAMEKDNGQTMR